MEKVKHSCKVISVYRNTAGPSKSEYAINLAAALTKVTETRILLIDMCGPHWDILKMLRLDQKALSNAVINSEIGVDVLTLGHVKKQFFEETKGDYRYIVVNLPVELDELVYEIFSYSDVIHFFVDSTKDDLEKAYRFLEDLLKKGLEDAVGRLKVVVNRLDIFDKFSAEEIAWLLRKDVFSLVPEPGILDVSIDAKGMPLVLKSPDLAYSKVITRIAKSEADKLLGLALGSGSAFGLAHIGVLKVLEKNHIPIDVLSGSSIGALIAGMWGLGLSSEKIEHIAKRLKNKLNIMRLLDFTIPISGILAGQRLKRFLKSILGEKTFEDLEIPVKIIVYDLANRETIVIEKGLLVDAIYMSIAVPGIFKPIIKENRMIIDGGVSDPLPVDILLRQGIKKIIAVNVLPGPEDIYKRNMALKKVLDEEEKLMRTDPFYIKIALFARNLFRKIFRPNIFDVIMTSMQALEYTLAENSCKRADVALRPVLSNATSVGFHLGKEFIERGEEEAALHIEEIKALVLK